MEGRVDNVKGLNLGRSVDKSRQRLQHLLVGMGVVIVSIVLVIPQADCSHINSAGTSESDFVLKNSDSTSSRFFPVGQRHQFLEDFLQPLKSAFMIPGCAGHLLAILHIFAIRFADLRYLIAQLGDAFSDRSLHGDRLAERSWYGGCRRHVLHLDRRLFSETNNKASKIAGPKADEMTLVVHFCILSFFMLSVAILRDMT